MRDSAAAEHKGCRKQQVQSRYFPDFSQRQRHKKQSASGEFLIRVIAVL
jgi:hypothetical protein